MGHVNSSIGALIACLVLTLPAAAKPVDGVPLDAIWRVQEFDFHFRSTDRYHSCDSLQSKITGILRAVGAGEVVVKIACSRDSLTNNTFARVAAAAPVEADEENVRAATTYDARTELAARLRQVQLPTAADLVRFPAEWRKVSIVNDRSLRLGPGDCELLQGMNNQIFPRLSLRVVQQRFNCGLSMGTSRPILVVEALVRRTA